MRAVRRTSQFKQDVRRMQRRGKDLEKLKSVLESLVKEEGLAPKYRDHVLVGQYGGTRECHIEPDWLLIYELAERDRADQNRLAFRFVQVALEETLSNEVTR